jgi:hypothetical protein
MIFSTFVQTGPGVHPASYTMDTGSLPGVKRSGHGVDHPPASNAEVKEKVEIYLYSWASVACSRVNFTLLLRISRGVILFVIVKSIIAAKYTSQARSSPAPWSLH